MDFSSTNVSSCSSNKSNLVASTIFVTRALVLCTQWAKTHLHLLPLSLTLPNSCIRKNSDHPTHFLCATHSFTGTVTISFPSWKAMISFVASYTEVDLAAVLLCAISVSVFPLETILYTLFMSPWFVLCCIHSNSRCSFWVLMYWILTLMYYNPEISLLNGNTASRASQGAWLLWDAAAAGNLCSCGQ